MIRFRGLRAHLIPGEGERGGAVLCLLFLAALSSLVPAFLHRVLFDRVIPDRSRFMILPVALAVLLVEAAGAWSRFAADRRLAAISRRRRHLRRMDLVDRFWRIRYEWIERSGPGALTRHCDDAAVLGNLRAEFLKRVAGSLMVLAVLLPPMFALHPVLAALRLASAVPAILFGAIFLERDLELERTLWKEQRGLATDLFRGGRGAGTLASDAAGPDYARFLRSRFERLGRLEERRQVLGALWEASAGLSARIGAVLALVLAVSLIIRGRMSFGGYIAFSIIAARVLAATGEFLGGIRGLARAGNAAFRHEAVYREPAPGAVRAEFLGATHRDSSGLRIDGLGFTYPGPECGLPVLDGLDLHIREGERVRLVGASGSGKSTLFLLILGHYAPLTGGIRWRGLSLPDCPPQIRREIVRAVPQEPVFFDSTVRDNLTLFGPPVPDRRIWDALDAAAAADVVAALPGGLDARLTGEGSGLSGGERQRLAVARLLLRPPRLVLLDEPVSALDAVSAGRVGESLERACRGRSVLLVSHGTRSPVPVHRSLYLASGRLTGTPPGGER